MEDLTFWLQIFATAFVSFWLGMKAAEFKFDAMRSDSGILLVLVTEENGWFYFHDFHDHEFLLQANTMKEGVDALIARFPDTTVIVAGKGEVILSPKNESV